MVAKPKNHHIDRRADQVAASIGGDDDAALTTIQAATLLGVSVQFLNIGRSAGWGPPFVRLSPRAIRYRKKDLVAWLEERKHKSVSEYR